jgi:mannose-6-phosphate isomerase-like protein (cupin superfamily)
MGMELDVHRPLLLAPGEGEIVTDRPERTLRILAELEQVIVTWFRYEPGEKGPEPHVHRQHTDAFYVLEGEVEFHTDDGPRRAGHGSFFAAPRGTVHGFRNPGPAPLRVLNIHAPEGGFVGRVRGS